MKRSLLVVLLLLIVCGLESRGLGRLDVVRQDDCQRLRPLMFVAAEPSGCRGWSTPSCFPGRCLGTASDDNCSVTAVSWSCWQRTAAYPNKQPLTKLWSSLNCWGTQWTICLWIVTCSSKMFLFISEGRSKIFLRVCVCVCVWGFSSTSSKPEL
jgi:hypothetical protein